MRSFELIPAKLASAVILCGGKSRRMGSDKARLMFDGRTLLSRQLEKYEQAFERVYVSFSGKDKEYARVKHPIFDVYRDIGPLGGIYSALRESDSPSLFFTAVDLPFGEPEAAKRLLELSSDFDACLIQRSDGQLEPAFSVFSGSCLEALKTFIDKGGRKVFDFLRSINTKYVDEEALAPLDVERMLMNINSPSDYEDLKSLPRGGRPEGGC